jgi:hypothetical protein
MRIAVIGRGNIGGTLGGKWAAAGHDVVYGVREPDGADTATMAGAVDGADVVVLAVPGGAAKDVIADLGDRLRGKVVVDATNDIAGSGKLHALDELADGALPVRAFNTLGWENFAEPVIAGVQADLLYAADEGEAQAVAEELIAAVGLNPVWLGGVDAFDLVDDLTGVWFQLAFRRGFGRRVALKVLHEG